MKRKKILGSQPLAPRRALLVDLENIAYDGVLRLDATRVADRLERVVRRAGHVDYLVAVAPQPVVQRYGAELARLGVRWGVCASGPDAADRLIVEKALELVAHGFNEVAISSGDHYFGCLAAVTRLVVIVPSGLPVARELRDICTLEVA